MKITIGKQSGFCFGVKRAYDLACACPVRRDGKNQSKSSLSFKDKNAQGASLSDGVNSRDCEKLYILGKLVHNDDVCRDLKKKGIREINSLNGARDAAVIFTAHGIGPKAYEKAQKRGLKIIDTTCPKVMKAQRLAKNYAAKGWQVLIFGDKKHKEVKSIFQWANGKAKIISSLADAEKFKLQPEKKYFLVSQTTQNVEEFKRISAFLRLSLKNFIFSNTICDSTDNRQKETRKLAKSNDAVIVIGGRDSANSRRLHEIAKSINPNSYFIENEKQLKKSWLKNIKSVAVTAGASTPEAVIEKTIKKLRAIS